MIRTLTRTIAIAIILAPWAPSHTGAAKEAPRERSTVFDDVDESEGIVFAYARQHGRNVALKMDVFTPRGDTATNRPLIILAFGGGFVGGTRKEDLLRRVGAGFTRRGYVAALIDYRLFERQPRGHTETYAFAIRSVHDLKAAVRYLRKDAGGRNRFGIDGRFIFAGGVSAGAIIAAMAGVLDGGDRLPNGLGTYLRRYGGIEGRGSLGKRTSSHIAGVLSVAGAIPDARWIDARSPALFIAHEEFDPVVPCGDGIAAAGTISARVSGGCAMLKRAAALGVPHAAVIISSLASHVDFTDQQITRIIDGATRLFARQIKR